MGIEPTTRSLGTYGHPLETGPFSGQKLRLVGQKLIVPQRCYGVGISLGNII